MTGQEVGDALEKLHTKPDDNAADVQCTSTQLHIGKVICSLETLKTWAGWSNVESAVRALVRQRGPGGKLHAAEWSIIRDCARTESARNGLAEITSALQGLIP